MGDKKIYNRWNFLKYTQYVYVIKNKNLKLRIF